MDDGRIVARIVDRLNDLFEGPGGLMLEQMKRENLKAMRFNWIEIEETLNEMLSKPQGEQIARMSETSLPNILWKVHEAALKVEKVLDDLDDWQMANIIKKATAPDHHHKVPSCLRLLSCCFRKPDEIISVSAVEEILGELKDALEKDIMNTQSAHSQMFSLGQTELVGRNEEFKSLQKLLKSAAKEMGNQVKVMCIVGETPHTGKSAIAKKLYHQPGTYFDSISWAGMSSGSFDVREIAEKIPQTLYIPIPTNGPMKWDDNYFSDKSFLLIIDGLESVEYSEWISFVESRLARADPGSVILVTTRSEALAKQICSQHYTFRLAPLSTMGCYEMLKVFLGKAPAVSYPNSKEKILWEIAGRCQGLPDYARNYAVLLRNHSPENWNQLLGNDFTSIAWFKEFARIKHLVSDYGELSPQLKRCISCFARFHKDARITVDQMVALWMAKGYLHSPRTRSEDDYAREMRGMENFNKLSEYSFFKELVGSSVHADYITGYTMHDHFHQFALHMAMCDMSWLGQNFVYDMFSGNRTEVRDTCLVHSHSVELIPSSFFTHWKYVRFLVLSFCNLEQLPTEVENMVLLQYLDLSGNPLKQLPERNCKWYSLQTLDVSFCYLLSCLPTWIGELQRLQHLRVGHTTDELHNLPKEFEKLTLIRTMDFFTIGGDKYKSNAAKFRNLNNLAKVCLAVHGELHFQDVNMRRKTNMENLELCFTGEGRDQEKASSIMRRFKPPPKLKMLKLKDYPGLKLPRWIQAKSLVDQLKRLSLRSAVNITSLPSLWKMSSLEFLWLYGLPNIKHIGCEFFGLPKTIQQHSLDDEDISDYSDEDVRVVMPPTIVRPTEAFPCLRTLKIEYLKNWETWEDASETEEFNINVMPCLEELITDHCPKLKAKPLRILRDTPWSKVYYPKRFKEDTLCKREANERNTIKPSSQKKGPSRPDNIYESYKKEEYENNNMKPPSLKKFDSTPDKNEKEENQKDTMKPPSQKKRDSSPDQNEEANALLKASYTKLRKFVRDAYISKVPAEPLEVLIPEGVLEKTSVTSYLSLDYLHDWFEKDRLVLAEQLCIWSKALYEIMTPLDKERVQMANSALTTTVGRQGQSGLRSDELVDFMIENRARLYLVPFLRPGHWELLAFVPENEVIYRFDSMQGNISLEHTEFLNMVAKKYVTRNLNSSIAHDMIGWDVVDIKHKKQTGSWECGYYVMLWMQKIALHIQDLDLESHFPMDDHPYKLDELEKVGWEWCTHVAQFMPELPS